MQKAAAASQDAAIAAEAKQFLAMIDIAKSGNDPAARQQEVQRVLASSPDYAPALVAQGAIQARANDRPGAVATYSRVLQRFPDFAPAQKALAALYADDPAQVAKAYDLAV